MDPCCWGAGSSPHTRGALCGAGGRRTEIRIIPAYAGSTHQGIRRGSERGDHPRIRGEHKCVSSCPTTTNGSSPHTRGAPLLRRAILEIIRIIPAYAGSTPPQERFSGFQPDHPRIRGEHLPAARVCPAALGSSPHTRGAREGGASADEGAGDHPRIRGEHRYLND